MTGAGFAFTWSDEGDMRSDQRARRRASRRLGISPQWATVEQVHGAEVATVTGPGQAGAADALVTRVPDLPLAVFTADCAGVVIGGKGGVGVAHAGWRGVVAGVVEATLRSLARLGVEPTEAWVGPAIGPCCFEVGREVAARFEPDVALTSWGTPSVDLAAAVSRRLGGIAVTVDGRCTRCGGGFSHRRDATTARQAAIGWWAGR